MRTAGQQVGLGLLWAHSLVFDQPADDDRRGASPAGLAVDVDTPGLLGFFVEELDTLADRVE